MVFKPEPDPNKKVETRKPTRTRKELVIKPEPDPISGLSRVGSGFFRFEYPMQISVGGLEILSDLGRGIHIVYYKMTNFFLVFRDQVVMKRGEMEKIFYRTIVF